MFLRWRKSGRWRRWCCWDFGFRRKLRDSANFTDFWRNAGLWVMHPYPPDHPIWTIGTLTLVGVAMVGSLFSADAWNNITFTAAEVKNPSRNLPLSLALGAGMVIALYTLANVAYLRVLPISGDPNGATAIARGIEFAADGRVGTAVAEVIFGPAGAIVMAVAILISGFGCNNGLILSGARIYYAMAKDKLFFQVGGESESAITRRRGADRAVYMGFVSVSFRDVRPVVGFSDFRGFDFLHSHAGRAVYFALEAAGMERPYRAFGYPVLPALYLVMAVFIEIQLLRYKPQYTWPGLIIVLLGVPVYWLVEAGARKPRTSRSRSGLVL